MCYSAEISLLTGSIGIVFSGLLFFSADRFYRLLGSFFGFVSLMQLIEFLLWSHPVCDDYNKTVSVLGMILNHLQPVVLAGLTAYFYNSNIGILGLLTMVYLIVIIPYSLQFTSNLQCTTRQCGATDPHIVWNWNTLKNSDFTYWVFLGTFAGIGLAGMPLEKGLPFSACAVGSYLLSKHVYDRKVMGSLWCFWTAFAPAAIYLNSLISY